MRILAPIGLAAALLATVVPAASPAQTQYQADFPTARRQFVESQSTRAAYTLSIASAHVRQEIGRCRDADVGTRLMGAEDRIDRLAARLRGNAIESVVTLDSAFAQTDRLLAEHHWRLATWELANQRSATRASVGTDLDAAASHFARSFRFTNQQPSPAAAQAIADARRIAEQIAASDALPKETAQVADALGRQIAPPAVIAIK